MLTGGRVPPGAVQDQIQEGFRVRIPVRERAPGDMKEVHLRRYIRRWLREKLPDVKGLVITDRLVPLRPGDVTWQSDEGPAVPVAALMEFDLIVIREGEMDRFKREHRQKKDKAHKEFLQELATVNDGGSSS
jgi:hypothetical protein